MTKKPAAKRSLRTQGPITVALLAAIDGSGLTRYELSRRSGVEQSALSRFIHGQRSLSLDAMDRLAPVLGLELKARKQKRT